MLQMKMTSTMLSSSLLLLSLGGMAIHSSVAIAAPYFATTADATAAATKLGYTKIKDISNGQAIYMVTKTSAVKGLTYVSPDVDSHNGGAWKAANSVANLGSKTTRLGPYNENLTVRIGD
jgi:Novel toxin 21